MKSNHLFLTKFLSGLILLGLCMDGTSAFAQQRRTPAPRRPAPVVAPVAGTETMDQLFPGDDDLSDIVIPEERPAPVPFARSNNANPPVPTPAPAPRRFRTENEPRVSVIRYSNQGNENRASERRNRTTNDQEYGFQDEQVVGDIGRVVFRGPPGYIKRLGQECIDQNLVPALNGRVVETTTNRLISTRRVVNGRVVPDARAQHEIDGMVINGELNGERINGVTDTSVADGFRERATRRETLARTGLLEPTQVSVDGSIVNNSYDDPNVTIQTTTPVVQVNQDRAAIVAGFIATLRCENRCLSLKDATYLATQCYKVDQNLPANFDPADIFASLPSCSNEELLAAALRGEFEFSQIKGIDPRTNQPICGNGVMTQQFSAFAGIDIAMIMDNSGSMATFGEEVVRTVFPQILAQARDLRPSARMIMMTHTPSLASTRVFDVNSDQFLTDAEATRQTYVAATTGVFQEEHLFDAANMNLTSVGPARARPRADLLTIFLTDEHDMSAMDGLQFVKGMRSMTTGPFTVVATHRNGDLDSHLDEAVTLTRGAYLNLSAADLGRQVNDYISEYINPRRNRVLDMVEPIAKVFQVTANGVVIPPSMYTVDDQNHVSILPGALTPGTPTVIDVFYLPLGMSEMISGDQSANNRPDVTANASAPSLESMLQRAQGDPSRTPPDANHQPVTQRELELIDSVMQRQSMPAALRVRPAAPAPAVPAPAAPAPVVTPAAPVARPAPAAVAPAPVARPVAAPRAATVASAARPAAAPRTAAVAPARAARSVAPARR